MITVTGTGFASYEIRTSVPVGGTVCADATLALTGAANSISVTAETADLVNNSDANVQDVIGAKQIEALPLNGRNFLDLAQLTAGVQIQDGGNLDPTKQGFVGVSLQGRTGRSTRVEVDGVDITDDTVGTTTMNISQDSLLEFQIAQSTLDPASSVTTAGAVNVITRDGGNQIHGQGIYLFRNDSTAAKITPGLSPFDRSQAAFRLGGPFIRNKLFWFANYEHTLQHGSTVAAPATEFSQYAGQYSTPFHEALVTGRLDWTVSGNWRAFYGFHFDQLNVITGFGGVSLSPYANRNLNALHTVGLDGTQGRFSTASALGPCTSATSSSMQRHRLAVCLRPFRVIKPPASPSATIQSATSVRAFFASDRTISLRSSPCSAICRRAMTVRTSSIPTPCAMA